MYSWKAEMPPKGTPRTSTVRRVVNSSSPLPNFLAALQNPGIDSALSTLASLGYFSYNRYESDSRQEGEKRMEQWEQLAPGGLRFLKGGFPAGTDTFLLSSFPRLKPGLRVCDLGCGGGLLSLLLLQRQRELTVTGLELLPEAAAVARRAAAENRLEGRFSIRQGDLRDCRGLFPSGSFDLVVCNPPYYPPETGRMAEDARRRAARAEVNCTLEEVCTAAAWLLRWGGAFCLVHKPERLAELCCFLREHGLEPKRLRLVEPTAGRRPSLLLLEGRRGGKPGLDIEPPLVMQSEDGSPTAELDAIYFRTEEAAP